MSSNCPAVVSATVVGIVIGVIGGILVIIIVAAVIHRYRRIHKPVETAPEGYTPMKANNDIE